MLRWLFAVIASLAVGLLLATIAFGGAWTGFQHGFGFAGDVVALAAGSLLSGAVIATVLLPAARIFVIASAQALPMLVLALFMLAGWAWGLLAAIAATAALGAWLGPWVFGRLPAAGTRDAEPSA